MKAMALLLAGCGIASAGDLRLTIHWVELSHQRTTELLARHVDGTSLFQEARELVKAREARLFDTQLLQVKAGENALAESISELTYPTEYDPPSLPETSGVRARMQSMAEGWWRAVPSLPFVPVNYETRNVGEMLELRTRDKEFTFATDLSFHPRMTKVATVTTPDGNSQEVGFPIFESLRVSGQVAPGGWQLSSVLTPKDAAGEPDLLRKLLVFTRLQSLDD